MHAKTQLRIIEGKSMERLKTGTLYYIMSDYVMALHASIPNFNAQPFNSSIFHVTYFSLNLFTGCKFFFSPLHFQYEYRLQLFPIRFDRFDCNFYWLLCQITLNCKIPTACWPRIGFLPFNFLCLPRNLQKN